MRRMTPRARQLIADLQLAPHPEGGHFRRIYESTTTLESNGRRRPALTAIHFLLTAGETSRWHRVDADEAWHWQDGEALELRIFDPANDVLTVHMLDRFGRGAPMHVVPAGHWQSARALGEHALVCCTVSPGFVWEGFELLRDDDPLAQRLDAMPPAAGT